MFGLLLVGCSSKKKTDLAHLFKLNFLAEVARLRRQKQGGGVLRFTRSARSTPNVPLFPLLSAEEFTETRLHYQYGAGKLADSMAICL
jgi:hypothetical protein